MAFSVITSLQVKVDVQPVSLAQNGILLKQR
jgi:hypothetical protein